MDEIQNRRFTLADGSDFLTETIATPFGNVLLPVNVDSGGYRSTVCEIIKQDCYRVLKLHAEGYVPKRIVDVGAQCGVFTLLAARLWPEAIIHSYEPVLDHFRALALNCPTRGVGVGDSNCHPVNFAVLGCPQSGEIYEANTDEAAWRRDGMFVDSDIALRGEIDLLKIDCEGSEVNIFRRHLENPYRIKIITGEWHGQIAKHEVLRCLTPTHNVDLLEHEGNYCDQFYATLK